MLLLSQDCSTLPLIHTLYCWVLSKEVSSTIFEVFGIMRHGIEPRSPGPWQTLYPLGQCASYFYLPKTKPKIDHIRIIKKNYLLSGFYLHWALYQEYLNLIFYFSIFFYLSWLELFLIPDLLDWIVIYIYIYIYISIINLCSHHPSLSSIILMYVICWSVDTGELL